MKQIAYHNMLVFTHVELASLTSVLKKNAMFYLKNAVLDRMTDADRKPEQYRTTIGAT